MRSPWNHFAGALCFAACLVGSNPTYAQSWRHFLPSSGDSGSSATRGTQSSAKHSTDVLDQMGGGQDQAIGADFALTQNQGPWLIVAASFAGDGAAKQAGQLASELRSQFKIAAYVHEMSFNFGDDNPGQGIDSYGAQTKRRYRLGNQAREIAVLVGDFQSIEDQDAQQMLNRIKSLEPNAL